MTRIYVDTEFTRFCGELISIGLYAAGVNKVTAKNSLHLVLDFEDSSVHPWVIENVLPLIKDEERVSAYTAGRTVANFISKFEQPVIYADWPEDISHLMTLLCQPDGMRWNTPELKVNLINVDNVNSLLPHHALHDAVALAKAHSATLR